MSKPSEKFHKLRKLHKKNLIPTDQYEKEMPYVYEEAIERNFLLDKITPYYDIDSKLETVYGRYSNVLNFHSQEGKTLSLRIIKRKDEGSYEPEWQNMSHKNIVPIVNRKWYEEEGAVCYLSPYLQYSLKQVITSEVFKYSKQSSMFLPKWIKDIASGLEYIHSKEFAHTNITSNNILIDDTLVAKLTDFHFLTSTKKASNKMGLKYSHRPPESFLNSDGRSFLDCTKVDVWALGILAVNIFTGMALENKLPDDVSYWSKDVYPQIFKMLKKKKFNKLHKKYLKYTSGSDNLKSARNFAAFCLHFEPIERPSVKDLLRHDLMNQSGFLPEKDKKWHQKVHWKQIEKDISLLTDYQLSNEDPDAVLDVQPSPDLENVKNAMVDTSKVTLDSKGQNYNIGEISDMKKEHIYQVLRNDTNENKPKCLYGDTEKNILILENDIEETEKITEPFQEDAYTEMNSEGDRLSNLLLSISEFGVDSTNIDYKEETNIIKQPKKQEEKREILNIEEMTTSTFLQTDDKHLSENHNENIEAHLNKTKDALQVEDDRLSDLLISMSKCRLDSTESENLKYIEDIKSFTTLPTENKLLLENHNENIEADSNNTKDVFQVEDDRLADLLISMSKCRLDSTGSENLKHIEDIKSFTTLPTEDKLLLENHNENIEENSNKSNEHVFQCDLNDLKDNGGLVVVDEDIKNQKEIITSGKSTSKQQNEIKTNMDVQDYLKETSKDEMKIYSQQKQPFKTEEIKFYSTETQQLNYEKEIRKDNTSITDMHTENKVGKSGSYWNHEIGVHFLNFLIDNNSSHSMLNPNNYLFKLVKKL